MSVQINTIKPNLKEVLIRNKKLLTPTFFPSISSYGLKIPIEFTSNIIHASSYPRMLISSYDLLKDSKLQNRKFNFIDSYMNSKILFVDSGCYESYNLKDDSWNFDSYLYIVKSRNYDIFTTFDIYPRIGEESNLHLKNTIDTIKKSDIVEDTKLMIPILHENSQEKLLKLLTALLSSYPKKIKAVAFSEKELGFNILSILDTILKIKKILNDYDKDVLLHILGCGDPKSIILYSYCGVDSFDSRDWAKRTMKRDSLLTYPLSQLDLLNCNCNSCSNKNINVVDKLLLHNLFYYEEFMYNLRNWINNDQLEEKITNFFIPEFLEKLDKIRKT